MAEASISWAHDQFSCSVCLDLLKDPVTIHCGHSYCMSCITDCWDQEDQTGVYSCPQCRQTFTPRPVLGKNVVFAEMVEKLKKTKLQADVPAECYAGPGDVECDACTGRKHKAIKSCLVCLNSYCPNHLEQHENLFKGKKHNLRDATERLQEMICHQHDKLMEVFCRTDETCICMLCTMDEHKNHDTVSATAERTRKQNHLGEIRRKFQEVFKQRQKEFEALKNGVEYYKHSAQAAVEDSERIFTDLISYIESRRSEVTQLIRDQEKAAVSRAEGLLKRLEQEIDDLRRRDTELEQLSLTENDISFIQSLQSFLASSDSTDLPSITISSHLSTLSSFNDVTKSVYHLKENLEVFCKDRLEKISGRVTYIEIIPSAPQTRNDLLQYSCHFTLDPNTVNKYICLSEGNRVATYTDKDQQYPDHPDRFYSVSQVLCSEGVWGRCYWEVEWSGGEEVLLSVSYKNISRKGVRSECRFGYTDQSWSLLCSPSRYAIRHNNKGISIPVVPRSNRIGVYVDHRAGILCFYSISDTMTLIHRVQTTFTQPLYAGFEVSMGSMVKLAL